MTTTKQRTKEELRDELRELRRWKESLNHCRRCGSIYKPVQETGCPTCHKAGMTR